ncbi:hypothetical protein PVAP13_5NG647350 [Panicum virgatum]|uniref:Uncharacterized protein n=1 Tax=Panicum virgatum TaxID=38727 RepID=A0A8T0SBJ0_PANVG|nr:hypothetical protein PVAP13_5NG647350 [Panicum virgatum]
MDQNNLHLLLPIILPPLFHGVRLLLCYARCLRSLLSSLVSSSPSTPLTRGAGLEGCHRPCFLLLPALSGPASMAERLRRRELTTGWRSRGAQATGVMFHGWIHGYLAAAASRYMDRASTCGHGALALAHARTGIFFILILFNLIFYK